MAASDYFHKVGTSTATTLSSPGYTVGNTSINVGATTNMPTDTGVTITIDETDADGARVAGTRNVFRGNVSSGTQINELVYAGGDANRDYAAGSSTRVYIEVNEERDNRLVDGLLVSHNQDGTLKDDAVTTDVIADTATTAAKLGTPVAFRVRLSADQTVVTDTAKTIEFDTEDFDLGGNFDTTTHRFVAPYDGVYLFGIIGRMINLASSDTQYLYILKNGTVETASQITIATTNLENKVPITLPVNMAAGDYVSFSVYHDFGSNRDLDGGAGTAGCYAWGHLVGRTD